MGVNVNVNMGVNVAVNVCVVLYADKCNPHLCLWTASCCQVTHNQGILTDR